MHPANSCEVPSGTSENRPQEAIKHNRRNSEILKGVELLMARPASLSLLLDLFLQNLLLAHAPAVHPSLLLTTVAVLPLFHLLAKITAVSKIARNVMAC